MERTMVTPEFEKVSSDTLWISNGSGFENAGAPTSIDDMAARFTHWSAIGGDVDKSLRAAAIKVMRENPGLGTEFSVAILLGQALEYSREGAGMVENTFFEQPPQQFVDDVVNLLCTDVEMLASQNRQTELITAAEKMGQLMAAVKSGESFVADSDPNVGKLKELMTRFNLEKDAKSKQVDLVARVEEGFVKSQED